MMFDLGIEKILVLSATHGPSAVSFGGGELRRRSGPR